MALLLISHNLGVVAEIADRVMIMYAGEIVEDASAEQIFNDPKHPYTHGLLCAIPGTTMVGEEFYVIKGRVPNPLFYPKGCRFAPRCPYCTELCEKEHPAVYSMGEKHTICCHLCREDEV